MGTHRERKSTRLSNYDYSLPGAYFITTCAKNRDFLFETPTAKLVVESAWHSLPDLFANIELDAFTVMPNHSHGVIWITGEGVYRLHPGTWKTENLCRDGQLSISTEHLKFETLSNIIGAFKTMAATRVNKLRGSFGLPVWQKSFYERVIRNEYELEQIRKYIQNNPCQWEEDRNNPNHPQFNRSAKSMVDYWSEIFDLNI